MGWPSGFAIKVEVITKFGTHSEGTEVAVAEACHRPCLPLDFDSFGSQKCWSCTLASLVVGPSLVQVADSIRSFSP